MWTCEHCGEAIEDQFDSCWKCARQQEALAPAVRQRLTWRSYACSALVAYATPFAGLLVSVDDFDPAVLWRFSTLAWMGVPAILSFLVLWPFLRRPVCRRLILACLWLGWTFLFGLARAKTKSI